ncbi:MAG TPA: hypothetical protein VJJ26_01590 [Candidatus Babeliales bacterium]|nr:hypothetical protein [Candidatus Babeliales bacterium]
MSKKMVGLVVSILCMSSMICAMDKLKSKKVSRKKSKDVPNLDFKDDSSPSRNQGSLGGTSSSGGTPKTPVKSFDELKKSIERTKNGHGISGEDSSQKK